MLKIRLMRIGAKKRPFYRVVVCEERSKRTGGYVELLGTYNPLTEPKTIKLKQDRIDYWVKMGAQPSVGYLRIIGKAPQKAPRKPKKEKKEAPSVHQPPVSTIPQSSENQTKESVETPAEETASAEPKTTEEVAAQTTEEGEKSES